MFMTYSIILLIKVGIMVIYIPKFSNVYFLRPEDKFSSY